MLIMFANLIKQELLLTGWTPPFPKPIFRTIEATNIKKNPYKFNCLMGDELESTFKAANFKCPNFDADPLFFFSLINNVTRFNFKFPSFAFNLQSLLLIN